MWQILFFIFIACIGQEVLDPYRVLNIPSDASQKRIKKAYKQLAKQYHPDKNKGDPKHAEKLEGINAAYDLLKNPQRKAKYDAKRRRKSSRQAKYDGVGAVLTRHNFDTLTKKSGKTWLIIVYWSRSNRCQSCRAAKEDYDQVCNELHGAIKCGRIMREDDHQWVSQGLGIRQRAPTTFIIRRGSRERTLSYKHKITKPLDLKKAIGKIYPKDAIKKISSERYLTQFLSDIHTTRALIFATKLTFLLKHAAAENPQIQFAYVHSAKESTMQSLRDLMGVSNLDTVVIVNSLLPFDEGAEHSRIKVGAYRRDLLGFVAAIKERAEPDLPLLSFSNFDDVCYNTDGKLDKSIRCLLYLFDKSIPQKIKELIARMQSSEGVLRGVLRIAAVDCSLQKQFCEDMGKKSSPIFVAIAASKDKFARYQPESKSANLDVASLESWIDTVVDRFEDLPNQKSGVSFPEEQIDSVTRARRKLNENMDFINGQLGTVGSAISTIFSSIYWFFENVLSTILIMLVIGGFLMGNVRRI